MADLGAGLMGGRFPSIHRTVSPGKEYRSAVIARHMRERGLSAAVCFSCGNASAALRAMEVEVVDVSPRGDLTAMRWWTPEEIARTWPGHFDATCGHLSLPLMARLAECYRRLYQSLRTVHGPFYVPSGSGETFVALTLALPDVRLVPVWAVPGHEAATRWNPEAPLASLLEHYLAEAP